MNRKLKIFRAVYFSLTAILAFAAILTPSLIKDGLFSIKEETLEGIMIAVLLFAGFVLNLVYEREIKKWRSHLDNAWKHIGKSNVLMDGFRSALLEIKKYPESKGDIKLVFKAAAEKILKIINSPCVMIRVAGDNDKKTLGEFFLERGKNKNIQEVKIGNNELFSEKSEEFSIISSRTDNANLKTFCVFPKMKISEEQKMFVNKIIDDFTMLYVIFEFYASQKK
jgi:hypothetical protein